jgi:hypothetical protein
MIKGRGRLVEHNQSSHYLLPSLANKSLARESVPCDSPFVVFRARVAGLWSEHVLQQLIYLCERGSGQKSETASRSKDEEDCPPFGHVICSNVMVIP